jgi:hypothetical protein
VVPELQSGNETFERLSGAKESAMCPCTQSTLEEAQTLRFFIALRRKVRSMDPCKDDAAGRLRG